MAFIQHQQNNLYYESHGQGEALVCIAGFSADHHAWDAVLTPFADQFHVITFDNRGVGQSSAPEGPYSISDMAEDVVALCKYLNIGHCHVMGSSMGGLISQALCHQYPDLVQSAIIANSGIDSHCGFELCVEAHLAMRDAGIDEAVIAKSNCSWVFSHNHLIQQGHYQQAINDQLNNSHPFSLTGYLGQRAALNPFSSAPWVNTIQQPALVIASDEDLIFTANKSKSLANQLPNSQYVEFENCGHLPFIEYPDKYAEIVLEFLSMQK